MKTTMRTLALIFLMAVMLTSTCITVLAADEIPGAAAINENPAAYNEEMINYSLATYSNLQQAKNDGTRLGGSRTSNIENAPALRVDQNVVIPRVDLTPDDEQEDELEETIYSPAPVTGATSFASMFLCGFTLIGCAGLTAKKGRKFTIGQ